MSKFRPRRPSAATLVAATALFVALGGTGYAAFSLPANSVGAKQLKNKAVTTKKIKNGAVTASKLNTSGLTVPNANHANSAVTATNANHATSADSATNATNATSLPALHWQALTLINSWVDNNATPDARPPAVAVDAQGIVHFRGQISCGSGTSCSQQFANLPAGFTPSQIVRVSMNEHSQYTGQLNIGADGSLTVFPDPNDTATPQYETRTGLDGLTYALG